MECCLIDVRSADAEALKWKLRGENEAIAWCPNHSTCFLASDETGEVGMFDARKGSNSDAVFQLEAHKENTTVLSFSPLNPVLFMTGSEDGKVKIWDMSNQSSPVLIEKQNFSVGEILAGGFCKYAGHLCIAAGEQGNLKVWDTRASKSVRTHYTSEIYIPKIFRPENDH